MKRMQESPIEFTGQERWNRDCHTDETVFEQIHVNMAIWQPMTQRLMGATSRINEKFRGKGLRSLGWTDPSSVKQAIEPGNQNA